MLNLQGEGNLNKNEYLFLLTLELWKKIRMTTSIEILRNMFELQKIEKIENKYQPRKKCFYIFTFLPFVAWLTDWYVKQKVEKRV